MFLKAFAALAITAATASVADAARVTNTYSTVSTFDRGAYASITQKFTLTFDPTSDAAATITDYSSSGPDSMSALGDVMRYYSAKRDDNAISVYSTSTGNGVGAGLPGYILDILFNADGTAKMSGLQYSTADYFIYSSSSVTSIINAPIVPGAGGPGSGGPTPEAPVVGAVPEPATWAMMILGFGVVGGSMRRRTKLTVRFA